MLNKKDPLIGAVQDVMQRNHIEREATRVVNEAFGIEDRKALPHEYQAEWDSVYQQVMTEAKIDHPNKQKLDVHEPEKDELTSDDFKMLRAMRKKKSVSEQMKDPHGKDTTSPSSMGINKPNYAPAGTTPDYAKPKTQTVNRAEKTSLPAGTMKEEQLDEKAVSKAQQRFMGLVRGIQKGKAEGSPEAEKAAKSMSAKEVKKFAGTKQKGLPEKITESIRNIIAEKLANLDENKASAMGTDASAQAKRTELRGPSNATSRASSGDIAPGPQPGANRLAADMNARSVANRDLNQERPSSAQYNSRQQMRPDVKMPAVDGNKTAAPRPGEKVPGEKVGTNAQLTAQATARKGFGAPAGGNYKSAQAVPRNPANFPTDVKKPAQPPTNWPGGRPEPGTIADKINRAGRVAPGASNAAPKAQPVAQSNPSSFKFTDAERGGKVSAERLKQWQSSQGSGSEKLGLGNFLNAAKGKSAVAAGKNDMSQQQKTYNIKRSNLDRSQ